MNNDYYQKEIFLAQVDEEDNIVQQVERWEVHEKGILHRGFTAILIYEDKIYFQHRKHKAFDGYWDLTYSSHQIYKDNMLQSDDEAIYESLVREWNLGKEKVEDIIPKGRIYYKAKDPKSIYTEHEIDYIYLVKLKSQPIPNTEYAYGVEEIGYSGESINKFMENHAIAPWVEKMIDEKLI